MDSRQAALLVFEFTENLKRYLANRFMPAFKVNASGISIISERQYHILFCIKYCGLDTLSALAESLRLSPSGLSTVISKMTANGLITKNHSPAGRDGRMVVFEPTAIGNDALDELTEEILTNIKAFYRLLSPEELIDFISGFNLMNRVILGEACIDDPQVNATDFAQRVLDSYIRLRRWADAYHVKRFISEGLNLTTEQFHAMGIIKEFGVCRLSDMSVRTGLSESAVSIAVKKLTTAGYLRKEKAPGSDGRKLRFYITAHGEQVYAQAKSSMLSAFAAFYDSIDDPWMLCEGAKKLNRVFASANSKQLQEG